MPSASFSSSRSYVRRSRRKGGHRIPLPSRTQSSKLFGSSAILINFCRLSILLYTFSRIKLFIDFEINKCELDNSVITGCFSFRLILFCRIHIAIVHSKICLQFFISNNKGLSHCIPFNILRNITRYRFGIRTFFKDGETAVPISSVTKLFQFYLFCFCIYSRLTLISIIMR